MSTDHLDEPTFDLDRDHLAAFYGGMTDGLDMIYEMFLEETEPALNQAALHLQTNDYKKAGDIIHGILPSFSTIGLPSLSTKLRSVYNSVRAEETATAPALDQFTTNFKQYLPAITAELARLKALQ
jgi:HPt (histidine-containing phosphotransfer) domain-containing protein